MMVCYMTMIGTGNGIAYKSVRHATEVSHLKGGVSINYFVTRGVSKNFDGTFLKDVERLLVDYNYLFFIRDTQIVK